MKINALVLSLGFFLSLPSFATVLNYQVPTEDPRLNDLARFAVDVACVENAAGRLLTYSYPFELTGVSYQVSFQQNSLDPKRYSGEHGEMICEGSACSIKYIKMPFNEPTLVTHLQKISLSETEFQSRLAIARFNAEDPGGSFSENPDAYCSAK